MSVLLLAKALILLFASRLLLDRRGTTRTLRLLSVRRAKAEKVDPLLALTAVRRAGRIAGGACLPQAVALTALLQREGYDPVLVLASRRETKGTWSAHAWVELDKLMLEPVITIEHEPLAELNEENGWVPSPIGP